MPSCKHTSVRTHTSMHAHTHMSTYTLRACPDGPDLHHLPIPRTVHHAAAQRRAPRRVLNSGVRYPAGPLYAFTRAYVSKHMWACMKVYSSTLHISTFTPSYVTAYLRPHMWAHIEVPTPTQPAVNSVYTHNPSHRSTYACVCEHRVHEHTMDTRIRACTRTEVTTDLRRAVRVI